MPTPAQAPVQVKDLLFDDSSTVPQLPPDLFDMYQPAPAEEIVQSSVKKSEENPKHSLGSPGGNQNILFEASASPAMQKEEKKTAVRKDYQADPAGYFEEPVQKENPLGEMWENPIEKKEEPAIRTIFNSMNSYLAVSQPIIAEQPPAPKKPVPLCQMKREEK